MSRTDGARLGAVLQARFLENEQANNKELTTRIDMMERIVGKRRAAFNDEKKRVEEMNNEVELLKGTLAKAANVLAQKTTECNSARDTLMKKRANMEKQRKKQATLQNRLNNKFTELDTLESQVRARVRVRVRAAHKEGSNAIAKGLWSYCSVTDNEQRAQTSTSRLEF